MAYRMEVTYLFRITQQILINIIYQANAKKEEEKKITLSEIEWSMLIKKIYFFPLPVHVINYYNPSF